MIIFFLGIDIFKGKIFSLFDLFSTVFDQVKIFDYKEKYELQPSPSIMTTILRTEVLEENEVVQKQVRDFFARQLKTEVQDALPINCIL